MSTVRTVAKNTTALFVAEAVSQGLRIVYFAILVRYIQAEGMGKISTAQALVSVLFVLISFGLEQLTIRDVAAARTRAADYVSNVAFIRLLLSLLFVASLVLAVQLFDYSTELATITYLYGFAFLLKAFSDIGLSVFQAFEKMEYNLLVRVVRDVVNVVLSLLAIYLRYSLVVIVSVSVLANVVELILSFALLRRQRIPLRLRVDLGLSKRLVVGALPFVMVSVYPLAHSHLTTLILSVVSTVETVGWFSSANTLTSMIMLLPALFMRAMFPVFSRFSSQSKPSLQAAYQRSFTYLLISGLAIAIGTFLTADKLIPLVFGSGFEESVPVLKVLAWLPLVGFVGHVNGNLLIAVGREKFFVATEGLFALANVVLALVLIPRQGYIGAALAILLPTMVGFVFYSVLCHRMLELPLPWKRGLAAIVAALLMAACVYYALQAGVNLFAIVLLIAPAVYGLALYLLRVLSREDISLVRQALKL